MLLHDAPLRCVRNVNISGHHRRQLHDGHHLSCLPQARLPTCGEDLECCSRGRSSSRGGGGGGIRIGIRQLSSRTKHRGGGSKNKRAAGAAPAAAAASNTETTETVITLDGVSKQLPGGRQLFADASLSFVRGAKVGVLGVNGSGKSTVLKIMAGVGKDIHG